MHDAYDVLALYLHKGEQGAVLQDETKEEEWGSLI